MIRTPNRVALAAGAVAAMMLAGCERNQLLVQRATCPAVAVAAYTGDISLFRPGPPDLANLDVVATITNVRDECAETPDQHQTRITYDVVARRTDKTAPRQLVLPVFISVVQAGNIITAKQIGQVAIDFAAGQERALGHGSANTSVSRSATSLSPAIYAKINRKRRAGDFDANVDPLADPEVRAALRASSFEVLIGFQMDDRSLAYNIAK